MVGKRRNIDMTRGVIWRQLSAYAIPILIGELFQLLYKIGRATSELQSRI